VILEVKPEYQQDPSAVGRLYIHSTTPALTASQSAQQQSIVVQSTPQVVSSSQAPAGQPAAGLSIQGRLIPLSTVATLSRSVGPLLVNHLSQLPSATIRST